MLGRIVRSGDFERVLAQPARARSPHFAVHFSSDLPTRTTADSRAGAPTARPAERKLSTDDEPSCQQAVDEQVEHVFAAWPGPQAWLGTVVPKRHARRAATRTLIKRQIRCAAQRLVAGAGSLQPGMWIVRLRAPFDRAAYPSAASAALRSAARVEIDALLSKCGAKP